MALIGFDNVVESAYYCPSLTTITNPLRELGILSVRTLLAQIDGTTPRYPGQELILKTELVVRDSTP